MTAAETRPTRPSRQLVGVLALIVLGIAAAVYAWRGQPQLLLGPLPAAPAGEAAPSIEAMVQRLAERMEKNPGDAQGWSMLGRSYVALQRPADAVAAFQKRRALQPQDAQALADLADAMAFAADRNFDGEPTELLKQALKIDPRNVKALELTGTMAFDRGDFKEAVRQWTVALGLMDAQSEEGRNLQAGVAEAQRRGGLAPGAAAPAAAGAGAQVSGRVVLAAALQGRIKPDDTVLIFARLVDGPRMPVAVLKRRAGDLPLDFKLDESTAMSPSLRLSPSMQLVVGARVSRSGQAMPQPGDLQGFSQPVPVGSSGLQIEITDTVK